MNKSQNLGSLIQSIKLAKSRKISDKDYDDYNQKFLGKFDGKSSERSANAIFELVTQDV